MSPRRRGTAGKEDEARGLSSEDAGGSDDAAEGETMQPVKVDRGGT